MRLEWGPSFEVWPSSGLYLMQRPTSLASAAVCFMLATDMDQAEVLAHCQSERNIRYSLPWHGDMNQDNEWMTGVFIWESLNGLCFILWGNAHFSYALLFSLVSSYCWEVMGCSGALLCWHDQHCQHKTHRYTIIKPCERMIGTSIINERPCQVIWVISTWAVEL